MTAPPPPTFEIRESHAGEIVRLSLTGELDLATTPMLEERLTRLRAVRSPVRLDLSKLDFIDSTGLHLLVRMVGEARIKRWPLEVEPEVAPQVMHLLKLMHLERIVMDGDGRPPGNHS
jgi:anti-sigma B factor antagonist